MQQSALISLALLLISCGVAYACHGKLIGRYSLEYTHECTHSRVPFRSISCAHTLRMPIRGIAFHTHFGHVSYICFMNEKQSEIKC